MASPQTNNGYIRMSTEIIDKLCKYHLSGREWQVLWVIIRKTWGWHKKIDAISYNQLAAATGLQRHHICVVVKGLTRKGLIVKGVTKKGNIHIATYGIQKDYEKWKVLPKLVTVTKTGTKGVTKNGNKVLPKMVTTIDTTKDILKDKIKPSADLSKQPFLKPTDKQKKQLALLKIQLAELDKSFDIFTYIQRVNKKVGYFPPVDSMINIAETAINNKKTKLWGYFASALKQELPKCFAELNIQEHKKFKNEPVAIKDILVTC